LQLRLELAGGRRSQRVLSHPRFRAAYDFLLLRGQAGEVSQELCQWWTGFQENHPNQQTKATVQPAPRKRRRRSRPRRVRGGDDA
jgi:poly(A) polymerase